MRIEFHVYLHDDKQDLVQQRLDKIVALLNQQGIQMSSRLDTLTAEVARNTAVDQSVITLINGLADQLEELKEDPVAIQKLADDLRASNDEVAAAVAARTPAAPT